MLPTLPTDGQSEQTHPTCGVIVEKNDEVERICGLPGSQAVFMVDPETRSQVTAVLVVCDRHDQALENGEKLIFLSEDGKDRIIVDYTLEGGNANDEPNARPTT